MSTTFNPSDKNAYVTLSGGNLTATGNSGSNGGVRGTTSHNSGKVVLGYTGVTINGDTIDYIGVGSAADTLGLAQGTQANQCILISDGIAFSPGANGVGTFVDMRSGVHTVDFALDFGNAMFWIRSDGGGWSGGAFGGTDPTTGSGGFPMGSITAPLFPYIRLTSSASFCTLNPSPGSLPTGYSAWDVGNIWASVEAADTFAAAGYVGAFGVLGNLATTEAADIFAAVGYPHINGSWRSFEAADIFSSYGTLPVTGHMTVTEAADIFSAIGIGRGEDGVWHSIEAPDTFSAIGTTPIAGTFHVTEAADRFSAIGAGVTQVRRRRTLFVT
jgi:hypothetical protein